MRCCRSRVHAFVKALGREQQRDGDGFGVHLQEPNLLPCPRAAPLPRGSRDFLAPSAFPVPGRLPRLTRSRCRVTAEPGVTVPGGCWRTPRRTTAPRTLAQPDLAQGARRLTSAPARPSRRGRPAALATTPLQAAANTARPQTSAPRRGQPRYGPLGGGGTPTPPLLQTAEQMLIFPMREPWHKSILRRGGGCQQRRAKAHPSVATQP